MMWGWVVISSSSLLLPFWERRGRPSHYADLATNFNPNHSIRTRLVGTYPGLLRRHALLQLLKPVQHHVNRRIGR